MPQEKEIASLHFTIEGKFIAELARDKLFEGNYTAALDLLDCLEGMQLEEKISILKGETTLTGKDSNITLIDEDPDVTKEIKDWYQQNYGSIFKFSNKYFKPYAYVDSWARNDLPTQDTYFSALATSFTHQFEPSLYTEQEKNPFGDLLGDHPHSRSLYYAEDKKDLALTVDSNEMPFSSKVVVLFKKEEEQIPFWANEYFASNPHKAALNAGKYRSLELRGADSEYDKEVVSDFFPNPDIEAKKNNLAKNLPNVEKRRNYISDYQIKESEKSALAYQEEVLQYQKNIIEYANNDKEYGWRYLVDEEGNTLKVPNRAYMHFALGRSKYRNENLNLPEYSAISCCDLKMGNDDPLHTDAWLGAGLDLDKAYDHDSWQYKLFFNNVWTLQDQLLDNDFNILNRSDLKKFKGLTVSPHNFESISKGERILVIPHLGVEFEVAALQCDAIICETGGKLAHLAIVGREFGIPIIRMENATLKFCLHQEIVIDLLEGKISYSNDDKKPAIKNKF